MAGASVDIHCRSTERGIVVVVTYVKLHFPLVQNLQNLIGRKVLNSTSTLPATELMSHLLTMTPKKSTDFASLLNIELLFFIYIIFIINLNKI